MIYSIGHSNRPFEEFAAMLQGAGVSVLVDVRSYPGSRRNPQFNRATFADFLAPYGIEYRWAPDLGGRRKDVLGSNSPNGLWQNVSFRSYADYAMTAPFREALAELRALAAHVRCAYMCSEAVWWRCHRRIITDYLIAADEKVQHIMAVGKIDEATITRGAETNNGAVLYRPIQPALV